MLRAVSGQALSTSTAFRSSRHQYLATLTVIFSPLHIGLEFPMLLLVSVASCTSTVYREESVSGLLTPSFFVPADSRKVFLSLLFSQLKKPSSLSLSSHVLCSSPLSSGTSIGLGFQLLSGESRAGPSILAMSHQSGVEGSITSLDLLALLLLMQPRRLLTFAARAYRWLTSSLSTPPPSSFSAQLLFSQSAPRLYFCMEL